MFSFSCILLHFKYNNLKQFISHTAIVKPITELSDTLRNIKEWNSFTCFLVYSRIVKQVELSLWVYFAGILCQKFLGCDLQMFCRRLFWWTYLAYNTHSLDFISWSTHYRSHRSDSNQASDYIDIFVFFNFWYRRTTFQNLKSSFSREFMSYLN